MITLSPMRIPLCPLSCPREEDGDYLVLHEDSMCPLSRPREEDGDYLVPHEDVHGLAPP